MAPPNRTTRNNSATEMTVDQKLDLLLNDMAEIKNDNKEFKNDIAEIKQDIKNFKNDVNKSVDFCNDRINDCASQLDQCKVKINQYEHSMERLASENLDLKKQIASVKKAEHALEQYSRRNCLEIRGVPQTNHENITQVVKHVARVLGFGLEEQMIDAVHRLPLNPNNLNTPRGIILKFCRRIDLEEMRRKTRVKNGFSAAELGFNSENKVFVNLSLTRETRSLWLESRAFKEKKGYKYCWVTSSGKVFLRREEGTRAIHVADKTDLDNLK